MAFVRAAVARAALFCLLFISAGGCRRDPPFRPDASFADARLKFQQGDLPGAFAGADLAMRRLESSDAAGAWRFRVLKAEVFIWQGKSRDALELLAAEPPAGVGSEVATRRVLLMGQASNAMRKFADADRYLSDASKMAEARAPQVSGDVALSRGTSRYVRHDLSGAEAFFEQALQIARARDQRFLEANARGSLGLVRMQRHQYAEAADWFQSAVAISTSIQARGSAEKSYGNLGWAYQSMGELDRALELFTEAESLAHQYGFIKDQQIWLTNIAALQQSRRDYDAAEATFRTALAISRRLEDRQQISMNLADLAVVMLHRGLVDEADRFNNEAL
jgi:tetratricopeptide (TPR) repeat protein